MSSININTARDFYLVAKHPIHGLLAEVDQLRKMSIKYDKSTEVKYDRIKSFAYGDGKGNMLYSINKLKEEYDVWGEKFITEVVSEKVVPIGVECRDILMVTFY